MATITQVSLATDLSSINGTKVTGSSSSTSNANSKAEEEAEKLRTQFLSILLTQMQHQNPLDPMDTKEFTGQLAQFSSLEQQITTNSKLDSLVSSIQQTAVSSSFGYIGQYVDLDTEKSTLQDGKVSWTYALPKSAEDVTVTAKDKDGNIVYSGSLQGTNGGNVTAGTYNLELAKSDLKTNLPDGSVLNLSISAKGSDGKPITADIHTTVKVESIQSDSTGTYLQAGGLLFEVGDIKKIVKPATNTNTTTA